jgi:hypothetical protein
VRRVGSFLRGLVMIGDYALVGGTPMRGETFNQDVAIPGLVISAGSLHASGLYVIDLRTGAIVHALQMTGVNGVYDIAFVPDVMRPLIPRFGASDEDAKWTSIGPHCLTVSSTRCAAA